MTGLSAVILAAGKGTRMKSDLPKVVHEVAGAPMVLWVARACVEAGCDHVVPVVGHRQELVRQAFEAADFLDLNVEFALQEEQHGTAHAVHCALPMLAKATGDIIVLCGDGPLIRAETLDALIARHRETGASMTLATATLEDPTGYGRVVRDEKGDFRQIVEQKNATEEQLAIREVNPSYYCFRAPDLLKMIPKAPKNEVTGEHYITDLPQMLMDAGRRVEVIDAVPAEDALSINTPEQLAQADRILRDRLGLMEARA